MRGVPEGSWRSGSLHATPGPLVTRAPTVGRGQGDRWYPEHSPSTRAGLLPSGHWKPSAFSALHPGGLSCCPRLYPFRGLLTRPAASLTPASYAHDWVGTGSALLTCWPGFRPVGLAPCSARTHWATATYCMGLLPIPRSWASLDATRDGFGGGNDTRLGHCVPPPGRRRHPARLAFRDNAPPSHPPRGPLPDDACTPYPRALRLGGPSRRPLTLHWAHPPPHRAPVTPSMRSRSRSAWPLCRAYSSIMWT